MTPDYSIALGGLDITGRFASRNVELTLVDAAGVESDSAEIVIADPAAEIEPPRRGALLAISLGYRETGLTPMGLYKVDQVALVGFPHRIVVSARAANNKDALKERRTEAYAGQTLGAIASAIAARHGLTPAISAELARAEFPAGPDGESYVGQHEESDIAFLTRLAERFDAVATVKQGRLIVTRKGEGKSVSGAAGIAFLTADRLVGANAYHVTWKDRPVHGQAEASWFDRAAARREPVTAGSGAVVYRFREPFPTERQARDAAEAKARELARAEGSARFELWGDPALRAEMQLVVQGVRTGVDGTWTIERVEHALCGGFTTKVECATKPKAKEGGDKEEAKESE